MLFMQGTITPIDESRVSMRWIFASPADQDETAAFFAKVVQENVVEQVGHDVPIWEHKIYQPNPILCDGDGPIAKYRKWFNQFLTMVIQHRFAWLNRINFTHIFMLRLNPLLVI